MMPELVAERSTEQVTPLRAARLERGWDVPQMAMRLRQVAMGQPHGHPPQENWVLHKRIWCWESGEARPYSRYTELLVELYDNSAGELGLREPGQAELGGSGALGRIYARYRAWMLSFILKRVHDGVTSTKVKTGGVALQGYRREQLNDAWNRYLPAPALGAGTCGTAQVSEPPPVPVPLDYPEPGAPPVTCEVPEVPQVPAPSACTACGQPMRLIEPGQTTHPGCEQAEPPQGGKQVRHG